MVSDPLPSGTRAPLARRRLAEGPAERPGKSLLSPLPHTESRGGRRMPPPPVCSPGRLATWRPGHSPGSARGTPPPAPSQCAEKRCSPQFLRPLALLPGTSSHPHPEDLQVFRVAQAPRPLHGPVPRFGPSRPVTLRQPDPEHLGGVCSSVGLGHGGLCGSPWCSSPHLPCLSGDAPVLMEAGPPEAAVVTREGVLRDRDQGTEEHSGDRHRKLKEKHWSGDRGETLPSRKGPRVRGRRSRGAHPRPSWGWPLTACPPWRRTGGRCHLHAPCPVLAQNSDQYLQLALGDSSRGQPRWGS